MRRADRNFGYSNFLMGSIMLNSFFAGSMFRSTLISGVDGPGYGRGKFRD